MMWRSSDVVWCGMVFFIWCTVMVIEGRMLTPHTKAPGDGILEASGDAIIGVLKADWQPQCSPLFITHQHTSYHLIIKVLEGLKVEWGSSVVDVEMISNQNTTTYNHLTSILTHISKGVREWWCVTFIIISDDLDFTAKWTNMAYSDGLLTWPTRLLAITTKPITQSTNLHNALSHVNALTISCQQRCSVLCHLPYSNQVIQVGKWSHKRGLTFTSNLPLFPRKFHRFIDRPVLLTTAEEFPPHIVVKEKEGATPGLDTALAEDHRGGILNIGEVPGNNYMFTGSMKQVAEVIAASMNFSYMIRLAPDRSFGVKMPNGSVSGMVGMVSRQEVNFGLGPFGIAAWRAKIIDYSVPIVSDFLRIVGGRGVPEVDPWGFLLPFGPSVWAAILGALGLLMIFVVTLASCFSLTVPDLAPYLRVLLQENTALPRLSGWERCVLGGWMIIMLVMTQSYSGTLMSLLAVRYIPQPFQSLRILLDHPSTTMIWEYDTVYVQHYRNTEMGIFREVRDVDESGGITYVLATNYPSMLRNMVKPGSHVFIGEHLTATVLFAQQFSQTGQCDYYTSREGFMPFIYCMIGPKYSPIVPALNTRVRWITEAGLYDHWMKSQVVNSTVCVRPPTRITVRTTLSLTNLWGMFVVFGIGNLLALLAFGMEKMWAHCCLPYPFTTKSSA